MIIESATPGSHMEAIRFARNARLNGDAAWAARWLSCAAYRRTIVEHALLEERVGWLRARIMMAHKRHQLGL